MKPIAALPSFPEFANINPGVAPGEPKYSQGFVPADTFPAEWANYLFNRSSKSATALNDAVASIWSELGTVLSNFNITPDASETDQVMEALTKLKAEAALAAHPVGSLYWTSSSDNPATTFGGGTWVQIKDKFILAAGDTYSNGATGGEATVTLTSDQMPSHNHSFTPSGTISGGSYKFTGTNNTSKAGNFILDGVSTVGGFSFIDKGTVILLNTTGVYYDKKELQFTYTPNGTITIESNPNFSGTSGNTVNNGGGQAHNNMPPYICKFCWERTA